jgi:hypothetical protein
MIGVDVLMNSFLYALDDISRTALLLSGFVLINTDEYGSVFLYDETLPIPMSYSEQPLKIIMTNTLKF